jgi:hypothetical protein
MNQRVASISTDHPSARSKKSGSLGSYITLITLYCDPLLSVRKCKSVSYSTTYGSFSDESTSGSFRLSTRKTRPEAPRHERTRDQKSRKRLLGTWEYQKEKETTS